ncbi:hypothetical protein B0T21DRAFT_407853 [Apiosordaria backusii]|uniref:FAD-binding PCMH-type domain-containing protein n=1 Tax=Apiosordaria backusii TaxID=314023 RepID=A0AA40K3P9_9PEZI|nr:hypothetical protein B0T21DRAFT_407853 [Apiosordaria backusii]
MFPRRIPNLHIGPLRLPSRGTRVLRPIHKITTPDLSHKVHRRLASSTVATFHYLCALEEYRTVKPFHINIPAGGIPGGHHTNEVSQPYHNIRVRDIRAEGSQLSLDTNGFEVAVAGGTTGAAVLGALAPEDFERSDANELRSILAPAMEVFLTERLQAETVFTFAFRYRHRSREFPTLARGTDPRISQPVQGVHADFTPDYARTTANFVAGLRNFQDLALCERRWQLISAWRPLHGPLFDWPLAGLDTRSLNYYRDLVASDNVYPHQCASLSSALPGLVNYPNSTAYARNNIYWSLRQNTTISPACFVTPRTSRHVSTAIQILTSLNQPFTVKSGGHTAFEGGSNIGPEGVTIDLVHLNSITLSPDRKSVSLGPGNRWIDVAEHLTPLGLAVVGGRASTVGVSGLILGGGISFFSGQRGWACDNVIEYELVTAKGDIVTANKSHNKDLFWALRGGGGSNFGIVTRFTLEAFEQGDLWASSLIWSGGANQTLIRLLNEMAVDGLAKDKGAHTYFVLTYLPDLGGYVVLTDQFHIEGGREDVPEVFRPMQEAFKGVAEGGLFNNTRRANISSLLREISQPAGMRQTWAVTSVSVAADESLLGDFVPLFEGHVERLQKAAKEVGESVMVPYLIFQPLPINVIEAMQVNGGNTFGLKPSDGPLMLVQLSVTWSSESLDEAVASNCERLISEVDALAEERGAKKGFVYMNYASKNQDVYGSYGEKSHLKLKRMADRWDPKGQLRKLWRGYFKL